MRTKAYLSNFQFGLACLLSSFSLLANAALFGDDEARRAILDLRQRLETTQQNLKSQTAEMVKSQAAEIVKSQAAENANLRGNLLELPRQKKSSLTTPLRSFELAILQLRKVAYWAFC